MLTAAAPKPAMPKPRRPNRLGSIQKDWLTPAWRAADNDFCLQTFVDYSRDRQLPFSVSLVNQLKDVAWFVDKTGLWTEQRVAQLWTSHVRNSWGALTHMARWAPAAGP